MEIDGWYQAALVWNTMAGSNFFKVDIYICTRLLICIGYGWCLLAYLN
jgi:hypothetical protein